MLDQGEIMDHALHPAGAARRWRPGRPWRARLNTVALQLTDVVAIVLVQFGLRNLLLDANIVIYTSQNGQVVTQATGIDHFLPLALICLVYFRLTGFYGLRRTVWDEARPMFKAFFLLALIDMALLAAGRVDGWLPGGLTSWIGLFVTVILGRLATKRLLLRLGFWQIPTVIIGCGESGMKAARELNKDSLLGYRIQRFYSMSAVEPGSRRVGDCDIPVEALTRDGLSSLLKPGAPHVVVAPEEDEVRRAERIIITLSARAGDLDVVPPLMGMPLYGMEVNHLFGQELLLLRSRNNLLARGPRLMKRVLDLAGAAVLVVVLFPVLALIAFLIWRDGHGPVFFTQAREGRAGRSFNCLKFRTMICDAETVLERWRQTDAPEWQAYVANNFKIEADPRVTPVGRVLRRFSLDELPQLFNVLRGEMSLVGPRPLLRRELADYGPALLLYQQVAPGITGLWQVSGRSLTSFQERAAFDEWYIKNWSLWYDLVILAKTVGVVVARQGSY